MIEEGKMYFFGCGNNGPGHYFWKSDGKRDETDRRVWYRELTGIDGVYAPAWHSRPHEWVYHRHNGFTIISCWDYSVDRRQKSNANFIMRGDWPIEVMLLEAAKQFPKIYTRFVNALTPEQVAERDRS